MKINVLPMPKLKQSIGNDMPMRSKTMETSMVSKPKVFASHAERRRWEAAERAKDVALQQAIEQWAKAEIKEIVKTDGVSDA